MLIDRDQHKNVVDFYPLNESTPAEDAGRVIVKYYDWREHFLGGLLETGDMRGYGFDSLFILRTLDRTIRSLAGENIDTAEIGGDDQNLIDRVCEADLDMSTLLLAD